MVAIDGTAAPAGVFHFSTITPLSSPDVTLTVDTLREEGPATSITVSISSTDTGITV